MFITNFCFLTLLSKSRQQTSLNLDNINKVNYNLTSYKVNYNQGIDMRYPNSTDFDDLLNLKIYENYQKFDLLKKLESTKVSELDKLKFIEQSNMINPSFAPNITAGGLFDDFYFNF